METRGDGVSINFFTYRVTSQYCTRACFRQVSAATAQRSAAKAASRKHYLVFGKSITWNFYTSKYFPNFQVVLFSECFSRLFPGVPDGLAGEAG